MRKTKIVCTIGPSCDNEDTLTQMCMAGMNVARLNFSHGSHEEHLKKIELIKRVRRQLNMPIAIMLDTKGPEYRTGRLADGRVLLNKGERFTFTTEDILGITTSEKTWRKLALSWGVTPVMCETLDSTEVLFYSAKRLARKMFDLKPGDRIVITAGATTGRSGNTNLIKIETV